MSPDLFDFLTIFQSFQDWIVSLWWVWGGLILGLLAQSLWLAYAQDHYRKYPVVLFELRIPREIRKTPRAMEQVFTTIQSIRNSAGNFEEKWIKGEVPEVFSCEIASFGGEVHFYMRGPKRHENMVKAALYGQYPDIEVEEVEDYVDRMPRTFEELSNAGYNIFGNELTLSKRAKDRTMLDMYPIRTYIDFEAVDEIKELDPIAPLLELMGGIKPQEQVWLQIVLQPLVDEWPANDYIGRWLKKGEEEIDRIRRERGRSTIDPKTGAITFAIISPADQEILKAIDRTISKPAFWTVIRYIYIAPREIYSANFGQRGVYSALNQYAVETYNKFRHNYFAWTRTSMWYPPYLLPKMRAFARRERIYRSYRRRKTYDDKLMGRLFDLKFFHLGIQLYSQKWRFVMNTEELATIFHMPTYLALTGPFIKRVEARKVGPPAGLPIYGGEDEKLPGAK
ncbi:MAG: hypothetical protein G01um101433_638 [Parcubacteria group bacterium Gr01-1014_33]|nr:MAG: hypothetical protein G01um101433_638 [Parcubacteria group bacterium Gr01-1014_33]